MISLLKLLVSEVLTTWEACLKSARAMIAPRATLTTSCELRRWHHTLGSLGPGSKPPRGCPERRVWGVAQQLKAAAGSGGGPCAEVASEGGATNVFSPVPTPCRSSLPSRIVAQLPATKVVTVR